MNSVATGGGDGTTTAITSRRRPGGRLSAASREWLEQLEGRLLFSTYTVTSLGDAAGTVTPTEPGKFNATTLRAAITAANAHSGADTVNFAADVRGVIDLKTALPRITDTLTVTGPGASKLTIRRALQASADFSIFSVAAGKTASLSGLSMTGGTGTPDEGARRGGAIFNAGSLSLANCELSRNSAAGRGGSGEAWGGAIYNVGNLKLAGCVLTANQAMYGSFEQSDGGAIANKGTMTVTNSIVSGNQANLHGGGIYNSGTLALFGSTVNDNLADDFDATGGGIYNIGKLDVTRCTISGNHADTSNSNGRGDEGGQGGGIANKIGGRLTLVSSTLSHNETDFSHGGGLANSGGRADLVNCTIFGNHSNGEIEGEEGIEEAVGGRGGGILNTEGVRYNDDGSYVYVPAQMTLRNCTVVGNVSELGGGGILSGADSTLTIHNTLVAGNGDLDSDFGGDEIFPDDLAGSVDATSGFNMVGTGSLVNGKNGNRVGVTLSQLHLGALTDNGGSTQTMALLPGSIAIDAGSNARAVGLDGKPLVTDQRLRSRFANGRVDVGAFEAAAVAKFYLVDAATGRRLIELKNGTTVRLSALDGIKTFSIEAVTSPDVVGSVQFHLDGRSYTENLPPYGVFGTRGSAFLPGPLGLGQHDLSATPFDRIVGLGAPGTSLAARFTIVA